MKVKVSELSGPALDWAVAKAEGYYLFLEVDGKWRCEIGDNGPHDIGTSGKYGYSPSTDWSQGGPLIFKYQIGFAKRVGGWAASFDESGHSCTAIEFGADHLVAACRSIVSNELGEFVEVPDELLTVT